MSAALAFTYEPHPTRVVFAAGSVQRLGEELDRLGVSRVFAVTTSRWASLAQAQLGSRLVGLQADAVAHVPLEVAAATVVAAANARADALVALGGGSAVGLAKAVARETSLPIVAVPTTYAGSEMTSIWGITESGRKRTGRDTRVRPKTAIYDPELTRALPASVAGPSGLNAAAHAMEALYARDADPITRLLAEESLATLAASLPALAAAVPEGPRDAHAIALYGAWLAGICLDRAAMGVHHKLCHVLGGAFRLPHADVHAVLLPHSAAFNRDAAPDAMKRLARALSSDDGPAALLELARSVGAPTSLASLGMRREDLERAADLATESAYDNPRPIERPALHALLVGAFEGRLPTRA